MLDIRFVRENPEIVKENIRKKFQNAKLPLVDEAIALDAENGIDLPFKRASKSAPQSPKPTSCAPAAMPCPRRLVC